MDEKKYRLVLNATLQKVEKAFDQVDPDLAECSISQGALTIQFASGAKCILSGQPSVRRLRRLVLRGLRCVC
jgi:frataxin-like iron-binding protein CyaY